MPIIDRKIWVRVSAACSESGIAVSTLHYWLETGRVGYIQPGGPGTMKLVNLPALRKLLAVAMNGSGTKSRTSGL